MNKAGSKNQAQDKTKKVGRKVRLTIHPLSPDELLNSLSDIIIERYLEESNKVRSLTQPNDIEIESSQT